MSDSVSRLNDVNALAETHVGAESRDWLGKSSLLPNEDPNQYDALLAELVREAKPSDVIERLWVKDIADLTWQIVRYRRIAAALVNAQFKSKLASHLKPTIERDFKAARPPSSWMGKLEVAREKSNWVREEADRLANDCFADTKIGQKVDTILQGKGSDADTMIAEAFAASIHHMEALDKMTASAEHRRNNALREIERRRSALGRALHEASDKIIEGEVPLVPLAAT
jgi:hypothetical protein